MNPNFLDRLLDGETHRKRHVAPVSQRPKPFYELAEALQATVLTTDEARGRRTRRACRRILRTVDPREVGFGANFAEKAAYHAECRKRPEDTHP
jgi:hypothetical protein